VIMAELGGDGCAQTVEKLKLIAIKNVKRMQTPEL
jgi:hypothetical protein